MSEVRIAIGLCLFLAPLAAQDRGAVEKYFERPGFAWECETLPHFEICYSPERKGTPGMAAVAAAAERELARMLRIADAAEYRPRIHLFVLNSVEMLRDLTGAYAAGASVPQEHALFAVEDNRVAMVHELNHEVFTTLWGTSEPWIAEGFAAYLSEPDVDGQCRGVIASGKARALDDMVNSRWNASLYPATVIYPELGSFVKYLTGTYGIARVRRVWKEGSGAIPQVFGRPLEQLEREWRAFLAQPRRAP